MSGKGKRGKVGKETVPTPTPPPQVNVTTLVQELSTEKKDINRSVFLGFLQTLLGAEIDVNLYEGASYRGIYYTATPFEGKKFQIVLKSARKIEGTTTSPAAAAAAAAETSLGTMIFSFEQIKLITVLKSKVISTAQAKELETDAVLSRRTNLAALEGRDLQSIDSSWLTPETSAQLDARPSIGGWNQFEANKRLYNYQDTYDENIYTKRLDRSQLTREQLERADSLAYSIENSATTNFHLREERGQVSTGEEENYDEEDRYSGVLRQQSPGGAARPGSKAKSSPTGAWRRVNVPTQPSSNSNSGSVWNSKQSYAAAAYKNSQPSTSKTNKPAPALPPGFGSAPATDGGYFKSNISEANIEPNLTFFGNAEAGKDEIAPSIEQSSSPNSSSTTTTATTTATAATTATTTSPSTTKETESKSVETTISVDQTPSPTAVISSAAAVTTSPATTAVAGAVAGKETPTPPPTTSTSTTAGQTTEIETVKTGVEKPISPSEVKITPLSGTSKLRATASEWKPTFGSTPSPPVVATLPTSIVTTTPIIPILNTNTNTNTNNGYGGNSNGHTPRSNSNNNNRTSRNNNKNNGLNNNNNNNGNSGFRNGNFQPSNPPFDQPMYAPPHPPFGYEQVQMYPQHYEMVGAPMFVPYDPNAGFYPQYFPPPNFDPSYQMGIPGMPPMVMMYPPDPMLTLPPQQYYSVEVVGMDPGAIAVAPALGSEVGMKGTPDPHQNE